MYQSSAPGRVVYASNGVVCVYGIASGIALGHQCKLWGRSAGWDALPGGAPCHVDRAFASQGRVCWGDGHAVLRMCRLV